MTIAVRIARAHTNKDKIAFCGYHGWHDWYLASNLADNANLDGHLLSGLDPKGVPRGLINTAIPFEYNNIEKLESIIKENEIGVIIVEPIRHQKPENDFLKKVRNIADEINAVLKKEDLFWDGSVEIKHLLPLLARDIGLPILKDQVRQRYSALKIAPHYGCHALRPADIMQYDNPVDPTLFEDLVAATGAQSVNWPRRLECCGNPILEKNAPLSFSLMHKKINDAKTAGADYLCTACTYCQIQFDTVQAAQLEVSASNGNLPSILYPQLLGLAFGLDEEALGLRCNQLDINGIRSYLISL